MSKATVTSIKAVSRVAVKVRDNFYTVEYTEERSVPAGLTDEELEDERKALFDDVNSTVDSQVDDIFSSFNETKNKK